MTLFPDKDPLAKEIESWSGFAEGLRKEDRMLFEQMLNECHAYARSINSKGDQFSSEPLLMALIFVQHKMIDWLVEQLSEK